MFFFIITTLKNNIFDFSIVENILRTTGAYQSLHEARPRRVVWLWEQE